MRRKQAYTKAKGFYFFNIDEGYRNSITISRKTREEAEYAFQNYVNQKKDCEWLGQWDGSKFIDDKFNAAA